MLQNLRKKIDLSLKIFIQKTRRDYRLHIINPVLYESIKEFALREGKRIRPLLLIISYKGYCPKNKKTPPSLYNASTCMELLHNFMLIHDDIIDRSTLRRGKPTMHKLLEKIIKTKEQEKLGRDLGIIAGDIVYALAIDAFLSIKEDLARKERALKYFIQTGALTAMGEFIDTLHGVQRINKINKEDVILNYTLKTARYTFDCPLVAGAILAGAPETDIRILSKLGILVGQAFQIQDDIIGIFDSQKNIGKSILSDLAESKKTLLVWHAYKNLKGEKRRQFIQCFNKPRKTYADLVTVRKIFISSGSLQYSLEEIEGRINQTFYLLDKLKMHSTQKKIIEEIIVRLFQQSIQIAQKYKVSSHLACSCCAC